jgi:hypothetical protein
MWPVADALIQKLLGFALDGDAPDAVVVQAIRDTLDRAGVSAKASIEIGVKPYEDILAGPPASPQAHALNLVRAVLMRGRC